MRSRLAVFCVVLGSITLVAGMIGAFVLAASAQSAAAHDAGIVSVTAALRQLDENAAAAAPATRAPTSFERVRPESVVVAAQ
jgi:hypothetical protein